MKQKFLDGHIILHCGPMFSGKSSTLISEIYKYSGLGLKCKVIKYKLDKRYDDSSLCTHSNNKIKADIIGADDLNVDSYEKYDVIGIDEGQFFNEIVDFCDKLANMNKIVIVSALSSTFERKPWKSISELSAKADEVIYHYAYCQLCIDNNKEKKASFSKKITNSNKIIDIGGKDKYIPVCRKCYNK